MMKKLLFDNWKFRLADSIAPDFASLDDYDWRSVQLPHDWSTDYPFDPDSATCGSGGYAVAGIGWYRNTFAVDAPEEQVILYFEGVYMKSVVYVNGVRVGGHVYGYTPFEVDVTGALREGANTLVVVVDNSNQPGSRWYSGSGITRDVWLETRKPLHIARYGVYITSPAPCGETSGTEIKVSVTLHAQTCAEEICRVRIAYTLKAPDGTEVSSGNAEVEEQWEKAGKEAVILSGLDAPLPPDWREMTTRWGIPVEAPVVWTPENPALYSLTVALYQGEEKLEERTEAVGIRTADFDHFKGFLLNGQQVKINGVCLHHDGGCVGAAVPAAVWERRLRKLKDMGVNAIRCAHNPPDTALLDLCDRMGFLVMDEAFDEWALMKLKEVGANTHESHGYSMYFEECHEWDLKTMLYRDRNHPSIILWSIGNEIPEEVVEGGEKLAVKLREYCHEIDPSRKITLANDQISAEPYAARQEFLDELDVVGYNYVDRWRKRAETLYHEDHEAYPHRCVIGTENKSAGYIRGTYRFEHDRDSFWDKPYYTAAVSVEKVLRYTMTHDFVAGDFMWTGIDYLGEAHWPQRSAGCGCIDTCGFEKDAFYFYKSVWVQSERFAYLCPHWNLDVERGRVVPVICYTNCEDAELFVNGKSYGMKSKGFPCYGMTERYGHFDRYKRPANTDDLFLSWDVPYEPGEMEVVGYHEEKEVCRYKVRTVGEAVAIKAEADVDALTADGRQIAQIEIRLVDAEGRMNPTACNALDFTLEGDGRILGIDNGRPDCHEQWKETKGRTAFNGMAYCIVQAGKQPGVLKLTVTGEGLKGAVVEISVI